MSNAHDSDQPDEQQPFRPQGLRQLIPTTPSGAPAVAPQSDVTRALAYIKKHYGGSTQYLDYPEGGNVGETSS